MSVPTEVIVLRVSRLSEGKIISVFALAKFSSSRKIRMTKLLHVFRFWARTECVYAKDMTKIYQLDPIYGIITIYGIYSRTNVLVLCSVQEILSILLQHHISK